MGQSIVTCLDMEGVIAPEIWLAVADTFDLSELRVTTREVPDYDELMRYRLTVLRQHGITLPHIQEVIKGLCPLEGAPEFLAWLRERSQVVILSDTYYEFIGSLMAQLHYPTVFCHNLEVDSQGTITNYCLRQRDQKRHAVIALKGIGFRVLAAGDSYNDLSMLKEADAGILFCPPDAVRKEYPQFPVATTYAEFQEKLASVGGFPK